MVAIRTAGNKRGGKYKERGRRRLKKLTVTFTAANWTLCVENVHFMREISVFDVVIARPEQRNRGFGNVQ